MTTGKDQDCMMPLTLRRVRRMGLFWTAPLLVAVGCSRTETKTGVSPADAAAAPVRLRVTATVGMVGDLVRQVGGDHVTVHQIMGSGVDPHLYRPTRDDVRTILDSDLVFHVGLHLEGKMGEVLSRAITSGRAVAVGERITSDERIHASSGTDQVDPHVWMDVQLWAKCLDAVVKTLVEFDPVHAESFRRNADDYRRQLMELDDYAHRVLATIPDSSRVLITSHDAFHYFGRAYGLEVLGVQGISTESEAGLRQVNALVDLIATRGVQAVFVESSVPRKSIEAVVEGVQSRGSEIVIGGQLYSDAMGERGTYEGTYIGMLDHNITVVARALGGQAPPRGMQEKLPP